MKLAILERVKLLEVLPKEGDILTLKILRKLRESLSFSEAELKTFDTTYEYICPFRDKLVRCTNNGYFPKQPTCADHNILMEQTGQMNLKIPPEALVAEKEVYMGPQAQKIASNALERLNNSGMLTEAHISLYEKFFPPEEVEVPEAIVKSMSE